MKKLILPVTILIATLSFSPSANAQTETKSTQEQEAAYKEIPAAEVPTAVTDALKKAYPTAILHKAAIGTAKDYQLEVEVEGQR